MNCRNLAKDYELEWVCAGIRCMPIISLRTEKCLYRVCKDQCAEYLRKEFNMDFEDELDQIES